MLARIHKAMNKQEDEGFTLIELLVVMIIIGILVAIAIPIFMNQKDKAHETAVKADVKSASTAIETLLTDGDPSAAVKAAGAAPEYTIDGTSAGVGWFSERLSKSEVVYWNIQTDGTYCVAVSYGVADTTTAPSNTNTWAVDTRSSNSGQPLVNKGKTAAATACA
jgi:prepilin-type N-terminal cleavage/methylation domain-containing protein